MIAPTKEELDALVEQLGLVRTQDRTAAADAITALRQKIAQLESVPTSEEVEAMAQDMVTAWPPCAAMLRALSRQVAAKDAEIARLTASSVAWCDAERKL